MCKGIEYIGWPGALYYWESEYIHNPVNEPVYIRSQCKD